MNMHVAQNLETRAEIKRLMLTPTQIVAPKNNSAIIGIVQDVLLGCFLFSQRDCFIDKTVVMNIITWLDSWDIKVPPPAILKPKELWTGKQIFSLLLPKSLNFRKPSGKFDTEFSSLKTLNDDTFVIIEQGEFLSGILDKGSMGTSGGSIIHVIKNESGSEEARLFIDNTQKMINYYMLQRSFTIGVGDGMAEEETIKSIESSIEQAKKNVAELIHNAQEGKIDKYENPGKTIREILEVNVNKSLNEATKNSSNAVLEKLTNNNNNIVAMVQGGSKGNNINISSIIACVGQQNVEGKRIRFGFKDRTLPHFLKDDLGAESKGFVKNSYIVGLSPQEFFFHAMGGREGLVDTAVKTSETGNFYFIYFLNIYFYFIYLFFLFIFIYFLHILFLFNSVYFYLFIFYFFSILFFMTLFYFL